MTGEPVALPVQRRDRPRSPHLESAAVAAAALDRLAELARRLLGAEHGRVRLLPSAGSDPLRERGPGSSARVRATACAP